MQTRFLGKTGVSVTPLCLGAMMFGDWGTKDHDESIRIIHRALDAGINFIDTADIYSAGESEVIVGKALAGGRRDDVILASKVHMPMGDDANQRGNSRRWIITEVENSLRRLQTDWIVEYQWTAQDRGRERFRCEQPPYSILTRAIEQDVLPTCERYGVGVIPYSPLSGGWLSGRYRKDTEIQGPTSSMRQQRLPNRYDLSLPANQRKLEAAEALAQLADDAGMSLVEMAIAFVIRHPAVTAAIIGPRTMDHLESQLTAADVTLTDDVLDRIDEINPPGVTINHEDNGWTQPALRPALRRR
jgi:aryl-alcohol dehydrogenase-like predicted oxidoreductase